MRTGGLVVSDIRFSCKPQNESLSIRKTMLPVPDGRAPPLEPPGRRRVPLGARAGRPPSLCSSGVADSWGLRRGGPPSRLNTSPSVFPHASPPVARSLFVCPENVFALPSFLDDVPSLEWQVEPSSSGRRGVAPAASGLRRCRGASASVKAGVGSDHIPDRWGSLLLSSSAARVQAMLGAGAGAFISLSGHSSCICGSPDVLSVENSRWYFFGRYLHIGLCFLWL